MLKKQAGFTLIEMMIVLMVISILLLITVPNVTKNNSSINQKGCEAYISMVQGQVQAYQMENGNLTPPTIDLLKQGQYINETTCPSGKALVINNGTVELANGQ